jgi:STE24 endopeptidase
MVVESRQKGRNKKMKAVARILLLVLGVSAVSWAQSATPASASAPRLDPETATQAYLAKMTPAQKARSDAYFEGGYWLQLWDFLIGAGIALLILSSGLSSRMRNLAEKTFPFKPLQTGFYWVLYLLLTTLVLFPMTVYEGFSREHKYGLATQTFGPWLGDQAKSLGVGLVLGGLAIIVLYGVLRRTPKTWWLWGSLTAIVLLVVGQLIFPVYIAPLFNKYKKVENPDIREPILSLARGNGIPAKDVYEFDASRQTTRVSANVSGFLGTMRISLNDNLLKRSSLPEIEAVMGHEMGHYVMHHVYKGIVMFGVLTVVGFAFVRWAFDRVVLEKPNWGIQGIGDVAGLPLLALLISVYFFVLTPVTNTITRTMEAEADLFGINTSRQPDGMAEAALKLGEYRKMSPGPVEEFIFFDHPSGRNRILMAMKWKAENAK